MADMDLTGVMGVSNLPKSHSHKADVTTYGGEEGFTSGMDFTTCVGTLNPRLTDAGRQVSSASSSCDLETSRHSASSQDSLPKAAANDGTVNRESTGRIAAVSETSVPQGRNVAKSLSHKADVTTYGGEEGFTSGMDFTTCVGTLNPRLTGAAGPEVPTNTSRSDLGTACDNVLPELRASNKRKLHQTGDHTVVFGNCCE
ncbi:hypothetical protein LSAT2_007381 [Lamellibrachia satsuma]|nr:hypothetical protein LSAT2_007381 [Lamellibrachia satsuma]